MTTASPQFLERPKAGEIFRVLPDGRWAMFFDSHTIQSFTECQQKFAYATLENLRRKGPDAPPLTIGTWWSKVMERFYGEMALAQQAVPGSQASLCPTAFRAATLALDAWVEHDMDKMALSAPSKYQEFAMPCDAGMFASMLGLNDFDHASMIAYARRAKALREQADGLEKEMLKDPMALNEARNTQITKLHALADKYEKMTTLPLGPILMAVQYHHQYAANDFQNWRIIGPENAFGARNEVLIGEDNDIVVYYQGRPDLVIYDKSCDVLMPLDQKTVDYITPSVSLKYKPHTQMAGYIYAIQKIARDIGFADRIVDRCLISACARKVRRTPLRKGEAPKPRFARIHVTYSPPEIAEWQQTMMNKACLLKRAIEQNKFIRNDGFMCHVYSGCHFRDLCAHPLDARASLKAVDYVKVEPWCPFEEEDND